METKNEHWACRVIRETRQAGTLSPVELIEQRLGDRKRHSESLSDGVFGHKTRRRRSREREYCHKCISKRFMGCVLVRTFLHYCHHGLQRFVRIYESPCDTWCSLLGRRDSPLCLTGSVATTAHNLSSSTSSWSSRWKGQDKLKQSFFSKKESMSGLNWLTPKIRWPKLNCKSQGYLLWLPPNSFGVSQSVNLNLKLRRGKSSLTAVLAARVC